MGGRAARPVPRADVRDPVESGLSWRAFTRAYNTDRLAFLSSLPRRGPVVRMAANLVFVTDPGLIETMFRRTNTDFLMPLNRRLEPVDSARGEAALEAWMRARRNSAALLHAAAGPADDTTRAEMAQQVETWRATAGPVPVLHDLNRLSLRETIRLVTGVPRSDLESRTLELIAPLTEVIDRGTRLRGALALLTRRHRRTARQDADLRRLVLAVPASGGLIGELAREGTDPEVVANFAVAVLLAGSVVPASAGAWTLALLAAHPAWQERARHDPVARGWFVSESLRLYPPTWLLSRNVARDGIFAGWRLRTGDEVVASAYVSHRDAWVFDDPHTFRPERWPGLRPGLSEYFPFGAGARRCIGAGLSRARLEDLVAGVLRPGRPLEGRWPERISTRVTLAPDDLRISFG